MPKSVPEITKDVESLQQKQGEQDVRNAKIDSLLEVIVKQAEKFEIALTQFQQALNDNKIAITQLQDKTTFQWKVFYAIMSVLLVLVGVVAGQFVHLFHP